MIITVCLVVANVLEIKFSQTEKLYIVDIYLKHYQQKVLSNVGH